MYCKIKIKIGNKELKTIVIIDTGNFLREPITQKPVIVIEKEELKNAMPEYILDNLEEIIIGKDLDLGIYSSKIRIIPFTSLGKENGILIGLKADKVVVEMKESIITINNAIIGIYNGCLTRSGKYHGLIGMDIIEGKSINSSVYEEIM